MESLGIYESGPLLLGVISQNDDAHHCSRSRDDLKHPAEAQFYAFVKLNLNLLEVRR